MYREQGTEEVSDPLVIKMLEKFWTTALIPPLASWARLGKLFEFSRPVLPTMGANSHM